MISPASGTAVGGKENMTLVILIGVVMAFILGARFLKILDRAVDWLYLPEEDEEMVTEDD